MKIDSPIVHVLLTLYAIGIVVTFGHAWAHFPDPDESRRLVRAFLCGAAWPFYWSGWLWACY